MHVAHSIAARADGAGAAPLRRWPFNGLVILMVLIVGGALTWLAWRDAVRDQKATIDRALIARATQIETVLIDRMMAYEALLHAGAGLFDASDMVSAEQWRAYALRLRAGTLYPGLQGFGFVRRVRPAEDDGDAARDYTEVQYLEPATARNRAALGFDMMSEPVRRRAMEHARDHGEATLSASVTLIQEITAPKQVGFLLYLPVYARERTPRTLVERRETLLGFVYCSFRAEDFLTAALGGLTSDVYLEVLDNSRESRLALMYAGPVQPASDSGAYERRRSVTLLGGAWLLRIRPTDQFIAARHSRDAERTLWIGSSGALLVAGLAWALAISRTRLARQLHAEQLASQREHHAAQILANSLDAYVAMSRTASSNGIIRRSSSSAGPRVR